MKKRLLSGWPLVAVALSLGSAAAQAQTLYIKDRLNVALKADSSNDSQSLKLLSSGTALEKLTEANGYIQVKTAGGDIGWIRSRNLVDSPTNDILLAAEKEKTAQLEQQIAELKDSSAVAELQQRVQDLESNLAGQSRELLDKTQQLDELKSQLDPEREQQWYIIAAALGLIGLVSGLLVGKRMVENKVRARFNGMKVW